jgi:predicted metal-dependent phosphoesterase TrpH
MKIDLHSHTTCSDGRNPPAELARLARAAGIDVLAVTDHDTLDGIAPAAEEGARIGLRVIAGVEMSSQFEGRDVHVLGIGIDPSDGALNGQLESMRAARRERVKKICAALAAQGVNLSPEDVLAEAGGKSVGRKHVARAMVKRGIVPNDGEAFEKYLGEGGPAHVPSTEIPPSRAASFIRKAGGLPVLAHPHPGLDAVRGDRGVPSVRAARATCRVSRPRAPAPDLRDGRERLPRRRPSP